MGLRVSGLDAMMLHCIIWLGLNPTWNLKNLPFKDAYKEITIKKQRIGPLGFRRSEIRILPTKNQSLTLRIGFGVCFEYIHRN